MDAIYKRINTIVLETLAQGDPIYIETLGTLAPKNTIVTENGDEKLFKIIIISAEKYGKSLTAVVKKELSEYTEINIAIQNWLKASFLENSGEKIVFDIKGVVNIIICKSEKLSQVTPSKDLQGFLNPHALVVEEAVAVVEPEMVVEKVVEEIVVAPTPIVKAIEPEKVVVAPTLIAKAVEPKQNQTSPAKELKPSMLRGSVVKIFIVALVVVSVVLFFVFRSGGDASKSVSTSKIETVKTVKSVKAVKTIKPAIKQVKAVKPVLTQKMTKLTKSTKIVKPKTEVAKYDKTHPPLNKNYMVIGVFGSESNAEKLLSNENVKGKNPYIQFRNSLYYVLLPLDKYPSHDQGIKEIRKSFSGSWNLLLK